MRHLVVSGFKTNPVDASFLNGHMIRAMDYNDITTMKDGKVVWTGRITVSADGKSRTVTLKGTGADGKKFKGKAVYDKQ